MKVYILVFEPYHDNSTILGAFVDKKAALDALVCQGEQDPNPRWDNSDTYEVQEWDTDTQTQTGYWVNSNPYEGVMQGISPPRKLGWRIEERTV